MRILRDETRFINNKKYMAKLILIRHGKSEWNKLGKWTGHTDVLLAPEGHEEAKRAGERLRDVEVHSAHVSELTRTHQTFEGVMSSLPQETVVPKKHGALNERHYGIHTGKNKWEVKESVGDEEFTNIRRSWDHPIPEGETLKDVHARVVPYYEREIMPEIMSGKNKRSRITSNKKIIGLDIKILQKVPTVNAGLGNILRLYFCPYIHDHYIFQNHNDS
jgi:2,3-bisphosphoglycerate-dependent phosphoglycerate mutase